MRYLDLETERQDPDVMELQRTQMREHAVSWGGLQTGDDPWVMSYAMPSVFIDSAAPKWPWTSIWCRTKHRCKCRCSL
jgi:hypothetical protein